MIQSKNYKLYFTVHILEYIDYAVEYNVFKNELCISTISSTLKFVIDLFPLHLWLLAQPKRTFE